MCVVFLQVFYTVVCNLSLVGWYKYNRLWHMR
jgi:hypothetical protein